MSMRVIKDLNMVHPVLRKVQGRIQEQVISKYNAPFRLFETGREHERHQSLISKGRTKDVMCRHLFDLENDPPLYATAVDYVYFGSEWSWNLRNAVTYHWYTLFGQLVLAACPELEWAGLNRRCTNYNHFQLRMEVIVDHIDIFPCVVP